MIAIPLFFLSNAVLALGATLSGCALPQEPPLAHEVHLAQTGSIVFASKEDYGSYKIRFDYQQIGEKSYVMTLHPFLMSPIKIALNPEGEVCLTMSGVSYDPVESLAMLDAYAPSFPWKNLANTIAHGEMHDKKWSIESWDPSRIRMQYAGSTVDWIVDSSTVGA